MLQGMLIGLMAVYMVVPILASHASAYSLGDYHLMSKSATFIWGDSISNPGSVLRNGWESAIGDWATASSCSFYYDRWSANTLTTYYESSSYKYGHIDVNYNTNTGYINYFTAGLNALNQNITNSNVARSTANHEFGHALGLDDLDSGRAIMNHNRDRTTLYAPQVDDKNGVKYVYGS